MSDPLDDLEARIAQEKEKSQGKKKPSSSGKRGANIVFELCAGIMVPAFIGYQIDQQLETTPLFLMILLFLGVVGSFHNLYRLSQNLGGAIGYSELHRREKEANKDEN